MAGVEVSVMVVGVILHELAHSAVVWYGRGSYNNPKLGSIESEAGDFYENAIFGGILSYEIDNATLKITQVGIHKGTTFYPFGECYATLQF